MVSVVVTLPFQTVSQNGMIDEIQICYVDVIGTQVCPVLR